MISIKKIVYISYAIITLHNVTIIEAANPHLETPRDFYAKLQPKINAYHDALEHMTQKIKKEAYNYEQETQYVQAQKDLIKKYIEEINQLNNDLTKRFIPIFRRPPEYFQNTTSNEDRMRYDQDMGYTDRQQFEQATYPLRIQIKSLTDQLTQLYNDMLQLLNFTETIHNIPLKFHGTEQSKIIKNAQEKLEWIALNFSEKNNIIQRCEKKITKLIEIKIIQSCGSEITAPEDEQPTLNFLHELQAYKAWLITHQNEETDVILDMMKICTDQTENSLNKFINSHTKDLYKKYLQIKDWQNSFNKTDLERYIKEISDNIAWLKEHNINGVRFKNSSYNLRDNSQILLNNLQKKLEEKNKEKVLIKKQLLRVRPKTSVDSSTIYPSTESSNIQSSEPTLPKIKIKKPLRLRPKETSDLTAEQFDIEKESILLPAILSQEAQALVPTRPKTNQSQNVSLPKTSRLIQARYSQPQLSDNSTVTEMVLYDINPHATEQKSE
ncbi:hypothetical protein KBD08_03915 [Candidatus Babeliales bacterium]|nr:hypothetical protein [Candidatus Babeliales bacterium]